MATLYELEHGNIPSNPGRLGKNYKNFGIMGLIQMTDEHKAVESNYNKAVKVTNEKINESFTANQLVA